MSLQGEPRVLLVDVRRLVWRLRGQRLFVMWLYAVVWLTWAEGQARGWADLRRRHVPLDTPAGCYGEARWPL